MDKEKLKKFCSDYEVTILNDSKRCARYKPPTFFSEELNSDIIRNDFTEYRTERLYTVEIPESKLNTLVDMETFFHNGRKEYQTRDMFEMLMEKEREERQLRYTNEAVRKAYENYSMMLHLAGFDKKL
jgi:hypothetical protein